MDHTHYAVLDKIVGVFGSWIPIVDKTVLLKASDACIPVSVSLALPLLMFWKTIIRGGRVGVSHV